MIGFVSVGCFPRCLLACGAGVEATRRKRKKLREGMDGGRGGWGNGGIR